MISSIWHLFAPIFSLSRSWTSILLGLLFARYRSPFMLPVQRLAIVPSKVRVGRIEDQTCVGQRPWFSHGAPGADFGEAGGGSGRTPDGPVQLVLYQCAT